jgi:hypothetical protein
MIDTTQIRARADAATPGPWLAGDHVNVPGHHTQKISVQRGPLGSLKAVDAQFIAAARTDIPALCDEVDRQASRIAELEAALTWRTIDSAPKEGFFLAWTPHFPESACCWKAELFHRANRSDVPLHLSAAGFTHWLPLPAPTAETP